jgi:hypothetical protein
MPSTGELAAGDLVYVAHKALQRERSNRLTAPPDIGDYCALAEVTGM